MLREKPQAVEEPVDSVSFFVLRNVYGINMPLMGYTLWGFSRDIMFCEL